MSNEIKQIDENSLQLVVTSETIGSLTTNAEQIRDLVKSRIADYSVENYSIENLDKAKADKALLNKAKKTLNDKRIELEKKWMQPFMNFKDVMNETVKLIDTAVKSIDTIVKEADEKAKSQKRQEIEHLADNLGLEELKVKLDLIFNPRWLNKTMTIKKVKEEMQSKIDEIKRNLQTLQSFGDNYEILATRYRESLDMNATISFANMLNASKQEASRPASDDAKQETEQTKEALAPTSSHDDTAFDAFADALGQTADTPEIVKTTRTLSIVASDDELRKVVNFLVDNNINFEIK